MYLKKSILSCFVFTLLIMSGCGQSTSDNPIRIGGLFNLSGFAAFAGEAGRDGMQLALEERGEKIKVVFEDAQSDFVLLGNAMNKLATVDQVDAIIGPEWAEFGEIVAPLADEYQIPVISPWNASELPYMHHQYYFSMTASERAYMRPLIDAMHQEGVQKLGIIYSNNTWSNGLFDITTEEVANRGILYHAEMLDHDEVDFRTALQKLQTEDVDAMLMIISSGRSIGALMTQRAELAMELPIYAPPSNAEHADFLESYPALANDIIYTAPAMNEQTKFFEEKYEARFGHKPAALSAMTAYDATMMILDAIDDGARTGEQIQRYLSDLDMYKGYSGYIRFTPAGQRAYEAVVLKKLVNGVGVVIEN